MSPDQPAIQVEQLLKRYGSTTAVDGLSFSVRAGEVFGLLGPNGAGKTTTVECIEGLRMPDGGAIHVLGLNVRKDIKQLKQRIGIQLQATNLYHKLTVREVIDLFASFYQNPLRTDQVIEWTGLKEKEKTRTRQLSGGQQQRLSIALALVNDPSLLFLDEPTTGLDPQARHAMWGLIEQMHNKGKTILMTTHYMEEAERLCDRVAIIDHGKIIALDQPYALVRQHFQEQAIEFTISAAPAGGRPQVFGTPSERGGAANAHAAGVTTYAQDAGRVEPLGGRAQTFGAVVQATGNPLGSRDSSASPRTLGSSVSPATPAGLTGDRETAGGKPSPSSAANAAPREGRAECIASGAAVPVAELERLPGVSHVQVHEHTVTCYSADVPATMAALLELARAGSIAFDDLTVRRATLEDVFLKLTGRTIRE